MDAPTDVDGFVREYVTLLKKTMTDEASPCVIATIWKAVNEVRRMGAAPFIDMIAHCLAIHDAFDFGRAPTASAAHTYLDAFRVHVMPMLDGALRDELEPLAATVVSVLGCDGADADALKRQMASIGL